jgi:hypothetical protein
MPVSALQIYSAKVMITHSFFDLFILKSTIRPSPAPEQSPATADAKLKDPER